MPWSRDTYASIVGPEGSTCRDDVARELTTRFRSPMGIRAFFGLGAVQRAIRSGGLEPEDLEELPMELNIIMDAYWGELPHDVQGVLAVAAQMGERFASEPVMTAARQLDQPDPTGPFRTSQDPYRFIRPIDDPIYIFADQLFHSTAKNHDDLGREERRIIAQTVADYALAIDPGSVSRSLTSAMWAAHVAFAEEGRVEQAPAAKSAWNLARSSAETYAYGDAIHYGELWLRWTSVRPDHRTVFTRRNMMAAWMLDSGQVRERSTPTSR